MTRRKSFTLAGASGSRSSFSWGFTLVGASGSRSLFSCADNRLAGGDLTNTQIVIRPAAGDRHETRRVHADRAARGHRHHRASYRAAAAGGAEGPGRGPAGAMPEPPPADWPRRA